MLIFLLVAGEAVAVGVATEFSAEAVQQAPMRKEYRAKMYVSNDAVRTESLINNIPVVEIVNTKLKTRVLLIEKEKVYLQQYNNPRLKKMVSKKTKPMIPCAGMENTTCKKLTTEKINNRDTEKWQFTLVENGKNYNSLHWIDVQFRMPVREFFHNGTVMELTMLGAETLGGRLTEKWFMLLTHADGRKVSVTQWYDPELKITTREEMSGGYVRELRSIKVEKQRTVLFELPKGYTKIERLPHYLTPQPGGRAASFPGERQVIQK